MIVTGIVIGVVIETETAEMIGTENQATTHMIEEVRAMTEVLAMIGETEIVTVEETMEEIQAGNQAQTPPLLIGMITTPLNQTANVEGNQSGTHQTKKVPQPLRLPKRLQSLSHLLLLLPSPLY